MGRCSSVNAALTEEEKAENDSKFAALTALYKALLKAWSNGNDVRQAALYELAELRAKYGWQSVLKGYDLDEDMAIQLIQNVEDGNLPERDRKIRNQLIAAINNIIEFAVCEEYQLYLDVPELHPEINLEEEELDYTDEELMEDYYDLGELYHSKYAAVEDADIEYAGCIAAAWAGLSDSMTLTYMTQNDDRVRPWHYALQGFTETVANFPQWMIPPIEWACRCYLIAENEGVVIPSVKASANKIPEKPEQLDDIFSESLAKCGRIFSSSHPYFSIREEDKEMLDGFVSQIKAKYYG